MQGPGRRQALSIYIVATLLAGCGGSQPPVGTSGIDPQPRVAKAATRTEIAGATDSHVRVLYRFNRDDGHQPEAALLDVSGTTYGTTAWGGSHGWGAVFAISADGTEHVLHSFPDEFKGDGSVPVASLIAVNGTLYGTTSRGGANRCEDSAPLCGTVFDIDSKGHEQVLHSFGPSPDGNDPTANLLDVDGTLYGTTVSGGVYGGGTVFTISTSGDEKVLYSFGGSKGDGCAPQSGLIEVNGTLYGTTGNCGAYARGTVFSISPSGEEHVLHSFGYGSDGSYPVVGLINVSGTLYGTTSGGYNLKSTVFSITTSGYEQVLYSFDKYSGAGLSALLDVNGVLYGTATGEPYDKGFIYGITPSGNEHLVYSFKGQRGSEPLAPLIEVNGKLLGTTAYGGLPGHGWGEVFELKPSK